MNVVDVIEFAEKYCQRFDFIEHLFSSSKSCVSREFCCYEIVVRNVELVATVVDFCYISSIVNNWNPKITTNIKILRFLFNVTFDTDVGT